MQQTSDTVQLTNFTEMPFMLSEAAFDMDLLFMVTVLPRMAWQVKESTLIVSRNQQGVQPATQALMTWNEPSQLITAHGKPDAPLLPSMRDSAVFDPRRVVSAAA